MGFPDFATFFTAVTGNEPFPWQRQLADFAISSRAFPEAVTVPTGLGKTSAMLAHVYALAHDVAHNGVRHRSYPMRFFHAVERRVVADAAYEMAQAVSAAVNPAEAADDPVLGPVRAALQELVPEPFRDFEPVIAVGAFHGGRRDTRDWLRPVGAVIACATVTQVASRFAFRGVTVSQTSLPIHAAIVGMDSVIAVDEPHLSVPAITAMRQGSVVQRDGALIRADDGTDHPAPLATVPGCQVTMLGATPPRGLEAVTVCGIGDGDRAHPVAARRIGAAKALRLVRIESGTADKITAAMAAAALDAHRRDRERGENPVGGTDGVLVFCNSVDLARRVYTKLAGAKGKGKVDALLIHGKMRGGDRREAEVTRGVITVSTQALEVGADFDGFEVITQPCSLSALIQRAGRCNRRGDMDAAEVVMVAGPDLDRATAAVYGLPVGDEVTEPGKGKQKPKTFRRSEAAALLTAVETLCGGGPVPFGPDDLDAFTTAAEAVVGDLNPDLLRTATLHAEAARYLARTDPPAPFDVSVLLSGPDARRGIDVTLAWRRDSDLDLIGDARVADPETVTVPISAVRALLSRASGTGITASTAPVVTDIDSVETVTDAATAVSADVLAKVRMRSGDRRWVAPASLRDIHPGAQLVLASSLGGYGQTGFDASEPAEVTDISDAVAARSGSGRFIAHGELHDQLIDAIDFDADDDALAAIARVVCEKLDGSSVGADTAVTVLPIVQYAGDELQRRFVVVVGEHGGMFIDESHRRCALLGEHGHQVGAWTAAAAAALPLDDGLAAALAEAGRRHDDGKADPRFQRALGSSGDPAKPAKAKGRRRSDSERARLREQAQLPTGWRHEVASLHGVGDELVAHIVVSHHRHGRPLIFHADADAERTGDIRISAHADTFDRLNDRYGPWGLALLETVMRWCDHRASAHPWTAAQAAAAGAPTVYPSPRMISTPALLADTTPEYVVRLPGLSSSPMGGTMAVVGLLHALDVTGHGPARLRWNPDDGCVEIGAHSDLSAVIGEMGRDPKMWTYISEEIAARRGNPKDCLTSKHGRMLDPQHITAGLADTHPLHRLLPDTVARDSEGRQRLSAMGITNNGTVFTSANRPADTRAFFSTTAGFETAATNAEKGGGIDTDPSDYPATINRPDMLAWALDGFFALGWCPDVATISNRQCTLPQPTRWTTLSGYRALALAAAADGPHAVWRKAMVTEHMGVWDLVQHRVGV